jgi:hypothetical protein
MDKNSSLGSFFADLIRVYALHWRKIPETNRRMNWIIFTGLIYGGTIGIIAGLFLKISNYTNESIGDYRQLIMNGFIMLIIGLGLMLFLGHRPKK